VSPTPAVEYAVKGKALTICQPYAELIARGEKRVENRSWPTRYRGQLLIHAGKSREWLSGDGSHPADNYGIPLPAMQFGALIAIATLVDCLWISRIRAGLYDALYPWLRDHEHTEGDVCWVLTDVRRLSAPIPCRGAQGLWDYEGGT